MREIKFRVWDKNDKRIFIDPQMIDFYNKRIGYMQYQTEYMPDTSYSFPVGFEEFEYSELMEFTGLCDKNGEDIYEGDIVKFLNGIFEVIWCNEKASFMLKNKEYKEFLNFICENNNGMEIVGNIYENSELLKENNN